MTRQIGRCGTHTARMTRPEEFDERFPGPDLAPEVWTTSYLPAWSSRAAAAAHYTLEADGLHLTIPPDHPLWCPDLHPSPLRVSAVQSGNRSGPLGSTQGQQPFREGLLVREEQPTVLGYTPRYGRIEVTCSARVSPASMFSAWMVGLEDEPDHCAPLHRRLAARPRRVLRRRPAHARLRAGARLPDAAHPRGLRLPGAPLGRRHGRPRARRAPRARNRVTPPWSRPRSWSRRSPRVGRDRVRRAAPRC